MKEKVCIVDYGSGNQKSLFNLISYMNFDVIISCEFNDIKNSTHLLLFGVGSYPSLMKKLREKNLINVLSEQVLIKKKPFLGICVGMQILSTKGLEFYETDGLNWIQGEVRLLSTNLKMPHIGWNNIKIINSGLDLKINNFDFYFLHSYVFDVINKSEVIAITEYGEYFPSIVNKENIWGFQFHPEKSQVAGQLILKNFFNSN